MDKMLLTVEDISKMLSLGQTKVYELLADGALGPKIYLGRAVRVRLVDVQAFVEKKAEETATRTLPGDAT